MSEPINLTQSQSEYWMEKLIARADKIGAQGEVPIAALILDKNGHCIGYGRNRREKFGDPLGHAELIALRQAAWIKNDWRFNDCTLIVTLEPCPMCAGALAQARMGQVVFGAFDLKRGAFGGTLDLSNHASSHHIISVKKGILEYKIKKQIQTWFKLRR